jgi:magnesium transporter
MLGKLALPEIRELIDAHDDDTLREVVNRWHSADLADLVNALSTSEQVHVLRLIKPRLAADGFAYLDVDTQQEVLKSLSVEESKYILNEMAPDDRTALLAELPPDQAERLIDLLDPEQKVIARALLD